MKALLEKVEQRLKDQDDTLFIRWLKDDTVSAYDKLARWFPCCAGFAFGFKDLNLLVLRYPDEEAAKDKFKNVINQHSQEDANHWPMYLSDLKALGLDKTGTFSEFLKEMWSNDTVKQRWATYRFCQLAEVAKNPIDRYAIVETIEMFGHYLFGVFKDISAEYAAETGIQLKYLGQQHFDKEIGFLINQDDDDVQAEILKIELTPSDRQRISEYVLEACDLIEERWIEFFQYAKKYNSEYKVDNCTSEESRQPS